MADWRGTGASTAETYRRMGEIELRGVSPSYERLCLGVADDASVLALLDELPRPKRQPNLLLGTVRFLGGPVADYPTFRAFVLGHRREVLATMRERRTQTNEPRRCTAYLPVLAALPQPVALLEVGASAGLCLYPDRWAYEYRTPDGTHRVGERAGLLTCDATGPVPYPGTLPDVVWRRGLDLNPLDVTSDDDVRWLECLIWPEETDRFGRLRDAVAIARADPPTITRGDLGHDLPAVIDTAPADATLVVFHSAVLAYVDEPGRIAFAALMRSLAAERGVVWLSNEAPGVIPGVDQDPGRPTFVLARDGEGIAYANGHGATLEWLAV